MAAPITHIALTSKIFNKYFSNLDAKTFYIGTCFPDIRYLKVIDREKTHLQVTKLDELKSEPPFIAGLKFHNLLDQAREKFLVSRNIYSLCPESKYTTQAVKSLEDKVLYSKVEDWQVFITYLGSVLNEEQLFGIDQKYLEHWHKTLQDYFSQQPNKRSIEMFVQAISFPQDAVDEVVNTVNIIERVPGVNLYINDLYNNLETLLD